MVSRRNFMSIILMMAVIFVMFQFSQLIMDVGSQYDVNEFALETDQIPTWTEETWQGKNYVNETESYVLFFTNGNAELENIISQWCTYTKRNLIIANNIKEYQMGSVLPELILLDTCNIELGVDDSFLTDLSDYQVPMIFCNLPDSTQIKGSNTMRAVLGIREVRSLETQVEGIRIFEGFFLGGEALYQVQTEDDAERQDLNLTIPWYVMDSGTKTYMVGIKDEEIVKREDFPGLIWRNTYNNTKIFAVCGDYMSTLAGLGILDSMVYELNSYEVYPVVNAQNVLVANFPGFSSENNDELMRIYSRSPQMTFRDIMWPSISAMAETNKLQLTCFFNTQYDYTDGIEPEASDVNFYLQQLKQLSSEAGISLKYNDSVSFDDMLASDTDFYESLESQYQYQALFVEGKDLMNTVEAIKTSDLLEGTRTVAGEYTGETPLLSYLTQSVTLQNTTGNADSHTFMDNMITRSVQTSLCYSNVLLNLQDAVWPQDVSDQWQHLYDDMASNINTYWNGDTLFEQTTLSESDLRVRNFLNLNYRDERKGDTLVLNVSNFGEEAWFLLRTHDEKITAIRGGEYVKVEKNAYLIKVLDSVVEIDLKALSLQEQGAKTW